MTLHHVTQLDHPNFDADRLLIDLEEFESQIDFINGPFAIELRLKR
jgi:hypothetical protein